MRASRLRLAVHGRLRLAVPLAIAGTALLVAACGGSARRAHGESLSGRTTTSAITSTVAARRSSSVAPPSPAQIRKAAALTAAEPGFRAQVQASIRLPQLDGNALTAVGSGHFDPRSNSGTLNLAVQLPGLLGLVGPLPTHLVLADGEAYAQVPSELASQLSTSAGWLEANPAQLDLGGSLSPSTILGQIARDATTDVPAQRARVTIDPATGLVSTIALGYSEPGGYRVHVRLRFQGFGIEPASTAPPANEVGDLAAALRSLGF